MCSAASPHAEPGTRGRAPPVLFTLGYEGLLLDEALARLTGAGVVTLIDVRAVASSRKPGFSKTVLARSLAAAGIRYHHSRALGTPKPGRQAARAGRPEIMRRIFAAHLATEAAQIALAEATALARAAPSCLLCFEHLPAHCHRAMVAADIARALGQEVVDL